MAREAVVVEAVRTPIGKRGGALSGAHAVDLSADVLRALAERTGNTKFELAACATQVEAGQALLDRALLALVAGELSGADAAIAKLFCTEMQARVVDRCLQLFGGYGYITEFPIARLYADARVTRIYGGTSEVMKSIISKSLGL